MYCIKWRVRWRCLKFKPVRINRLFLYINFRGFCVSLHSHPHHLNMIHFSFIRVCVHSVLLLSYFVRKLSIMLNRTHKIGYFVLYLNLKKCFWYFFKLMFYSIYVIFNCVWMRYGRESINKIYFNGSCWHWKSGMKFWSTALFNCIIFRLIMYNLINIFLSVKS